MAKAAVPLASAARNLRMRDEVTKRNQVSGGSLVDFVVEGRRILCVSFPLAPPSTEISTTRCCCCCGCCCVLFNSLFLLLKQNEMLIFGRRQKISNGMAGQRERTWWPVQGATAGCATGEVARTGVYSYGLASRVYYSEFRGQYVIE